MTLLTAALLACLPAAPPRAGGVAGEAGAAPQEPPTLEEAFRKIEDRLAPIPHLAADVAIRGGAVDEIGVRIAGRFEFVRGRGLRRVWSVWAPAEGALLLDDYSTSKGTAFKAAFSERERSVFAAGWIDPGKPARGSLDAVAMLFGMNGALTDVALWPRLVLTFGGRAWASRGKDGDRETLLLIAEAGTMEPFADRPMDLRWVFDASSGRILRLEYAADRGAAAAECVSWAKVNGVEVPERIVMTASPAFGSGSRIECTLRNFRTDAEPPAPAWASDPVLPALGSATSEEVRARLKKDPADVGAALQLAAFALESFSEREGMKEIAGEVCAALEKAVGEGNSSPIVWSALFFAHMTKGDAAAAEKVAASAAEKKIRCPEMLVVRALGLLGAGKHAELVRAAEAVARDGTYPALGEPLRLAGRIGAAADAKDVCAILDEACAGRGFPERLDLLAAIEPPMGRRGRRSQGFLSSRPAEFLVALASSGKTEPMVLAARAYAHAGSFKEAAAVYERLAADAEVRSVLIAEIQSFCREAKEEATRLFDLVFEDLADPEVLVAAADAWFADKARFERAFKRVLEVLAKRGKEGARYRDPKAVKPLLKKLVDANRLDAARDLLLAYADKSNASSFLYDDEIPVAKILGEEGERRYDFLKMAGAVSHFLQKLGMDPASLFALAKKRAASSTPDEGDVEVLCAFVTDAGLRETVKPEELAPLLERGTRAFPDRPDFHERLGDARELGGQHAPAAESYRESLRKSRAGKRGRSSPFAVYGTPAIKGEGAEAKEPAFDPAQPVIVKLARALVKDGKRDEAVAAVAQYLKDFPDDASAEEAARAYEFLDSPEPLMALKKRILRTRMKAAKRHSWQARSAVQTAVELGRLYLKHKRFEEAYVVSETALELAKTLQGEDQIAKSAADLRAEVLKTYGEEDVLRGYVAGPFKPVPEETKKEADEWLARLDEDEPFARQEAEEKLRALGPEIAPLLLEAVKTRSGEARTRLRGILLDYARRALREKFEKTP
ncbi:MAG: hypothetical protein HYY17_03900 [Planctomycetes bacterium]|nr:hypothetical protein [Planctomycetota bacterium]